MSNTRPIPNTNEIQLYLHCGLCLEELQSGTWTQRVGSYSAWGFGPAPSPQEYVRVQAGWTPLGLQVWCTRHDVNIVHIDFEGVKHAANDTRQKVEGEP